MIRQTGSLIASCLAFVLAFSWQLHDRKAARDARETNEKPNDWFYRQRAYPQGVIDPELYKASLLEARRSADAAPKLSAAVWQQRGPSNIGGRITTLAVSQQNPAILYAGGAAGGVLKSTDAGVHWMPLFDDQLSLSMGSIAVDPTNDNIVYAGTGEANSSGDSYDGFGLVKSTDGGLAWSPPVLEQTRHIGQIVINPANPSVLYVAAMGTLFSKSPDRGLYKSSDAGATWTKVLFVNDSTGVVDVTINPQNPNILLAAAWQRMRGPQGRLYVGGVHTGIYRTTDAGSTWSLLSSGLPAPAPNIGRPGIAFAPSDPSIAYVAYANNPGSFLGVYKTTNGGNTWLRTNDGALSGIFSNFGWYFGRVYVHPTNPDDVRVFGVSIGRSTNGGASWSIEWTHHVDHHAMAFHPTNPAISWIGNDGGLSRTSDGGENWFVETDQDLYITQFYAGTINYLNPGLSFGGTQDNGSLRTTTGAVNDWYDIWGGDGFYCVIDYTNANYQYAEYQYGGIGRTTDNWATAYGATTGINAGDRKNWSTPIVIDPVNPQVLYTGTQRVYRTTNRAASWTPISSDLTKGPVSGYGAYATITTIDVAPTSPATLIVGTDDANVWVTTNTGANWTQVNAGLPNRWITRVRFDPTDYHVAYVTCSGFRLDSSLPHIFRTTDLGTHWQDISSNLPEAPINVVLVDPQHPERLYVGTDVGAFFSTNTDASWSPMGAGLPNVVISDMALHAPTRIARAFTHGRSAWEINIDNLIVSATAEQQGLPSGFVLEQNHPNPFNPTTSITYAIPDVGTRLGVSVKVYDILGRQVAVLVNERQAPGSYSVRFDAGGLASGVYLYRLTAGSSVETRKMLLLR